MKPVRISSAYTLIELLIALTIIAILFGFGYAGFRDFSRRQEISGTVKQLQGDLRLAQQMALGGEKPTMASCSSLTGIRFRISSSTTYLVEYICNGAAVSPAVKNVTLPSDLQFKTPLPAPILFNTLANGNNLNSDEIITIIQTGTNNPGVVTITAGGQIK